MNSTDSLPPIAPDDACTGIDATPQREKMRSYASACLRNETSSPAVSTSNEYESFIVNSRPRRTPDLGRGSSRNFVPIWYQICGSWR